MAFIQALTLRGGVVPGRQAAKTTCRRPAFRTAAWRGSAANANANANAKAEPQPEAESEAEADAEVKAQTEARQGEQEREWRPHVVKAADVDESEPGEVPVELAEGHLPDGGMRPKLDLDADEVMMMWKMRRMLHKDDYKRIFGSPRVGEL